EFFAPFALFVVIVLVAKEIQQSLNCYQFFSPFSGVLGQCLFIVVFLILKQATIKIYNISPERLKVETA
ncbi:hypothetical protein KKC52_07125, partial [bacterium]|nr:hypothetical protein [bacterium]